MKILLPGIAFFLCFGTYHFAGNPGKQFHFFSQKLIKTYEAEYTWAVYEVKCLCSRGEESESFSMFDSSDMKSLSPEFGCDNFGGITGFHCE